MFGQHLRFKIENEWILNIHFLQQPNINVFLIINVKELY